MIAFPAGVKVWIAGSVTDMRRGMNTLALQVQQGLGRDPYAGEIFCFRGRRGDLVKILWHDGVGMSLYLKRLEAGKFIWPASGSGQQVDLARRWRFHRRNWVVKRGAILGHRSGCISQL